MAWIHSLANKLPLEKKKIIKNTILTLFSP